MIALVSLLAHGPRFYPFGRRFHHGAFGLGLALAGFASGSRALCVLGVAFMVDDLFDAPWALERRR